MSQEEKIALVTGCSSGIGLSTAIELAKEGYTTYGSMRNLEKKDALEEACKENNVNVNIIQLDVSSDESVSNAVEEIKEKHGRIDVLVNNAGHGFFGSVESTSIENFKSQFETDFFGVIRTIQKILPVMREQESGHIINVSSVAGFMGFPVVSAYVSCKFAIEGLTESLRQELYEDDPNKKIHAISLEPGVVDTKFYENMTILPESIPKYKKIIEALNAAAGEMFKNAMKPDKVAKKIISILHEKEPEPRYRIGYDADQYWSDKKSTTPLEFEKIVREMLADMTDL